MCKHDLDLVFIFNDVALFFLKKKSKLFNDNCYLELEEYNLSICIYLKIEVRSYIFISVYSYLYINFSSLPCNVAAFNNVIMVIV